MRLAKESAKYLKLRASKPGSVRVARDSLYLERIDWTGRPEVLDSPLVLRVLGWFCFAVSAVATLFGVVVARAVHGSPSALLAIGAWLATLGLVCLHGNRIWLERVRYVITERRVIVERGLFARTIERNAVSYARIYWNARVPGTGDLELVRAVRTGALRRRLTVRLRGLVAPDRVWAIVRGAEAVAPRGYFHRPLAQRLDEGERVLWAAQPRPGLRRYWPRGGREWGELTLGLLLIVSLVHMVWGAIVATRWLLQAGLPAWSLAFVALVVAQSLTAAVLAVGAGYLVYDAVLRAGRQDQETRYLITNKHVLISRGREELHLDRKRIVDVIETPAGRGVQDVFLVLDGPRARALEASGAFGERSASPSLYPVFRAVEDAESVGRILRPDDLPRAA
jgi:hypothetical protein